MDYNETIFVAETVIVEDKLGCTPFDFLLVRQIDEVSR